MNIKDKTTTRVRPQFEDETLTTRAPAFNAALRAAHDTEFERLKTRLLQRELAEAATPSLATPLKRAANDAAALAWETNQPLLVFPVLFEEITAQAMRQSNRQSRLWTANEMAIA